jgi:hypothetical protein
MSIENAYSKFTEKVNRNRLNDNAAVGRSRFISLFREAERSFITWTLEKRNEDDIKLLQQILVINEPLKIDKTSETITSFKLPEDYFDFKNFRVFARKDNCVVKDFTLWEIKGENVHELLEDAHNKPSFFARESFYQLASGAVSVYKDTDYTYTKGFLDYYRYPREVDIEGYIKFDGTESTSIDPEWDAKVVDKILDIAAKEFNMNNESLYRYPQDKDNVISDF